MAINRTSPKKGKVVDIPDATITIGTPTASDSQVSVAFTVASTPATGGPVQKYTAISNPGSFTASGSASPIVVTGLTNGTAYTFQVAAANATGRGPLSSASASATPVSAASFESIATISLSGSQSSIEFTSIPTTYKHLQIRGIAHGTTTANTDAYIQVGPSSAIQTTGYSWHNIYGVGGGTAGSATQGGSGANYMLGAWDFGTTTNSPNIFSAMILDILDYSSTTKTKTMHSFAGVDRNGSGIVGSYSGFWYDATDAIGRIKIYLSSGSFSQYTHFALYGVKG